MSLILPNRFTSQPQYPAPIDWGNPIARGLVRLANAGLASEGVLLDSVDPSAIYTSATPAHGYNIGGKVLAKNTNTLWICSKNHAAIGTGDHTIFGVQLNRSNNTEQTVCRIASTNITGTVRLAVLNTTMRVTNFNGTIATAPTASHIASRLECMVATRRNGTYYFFMNGQSLGSASGPSTVANQPFCLGGNSDQAEVNLGGLILRGLSDDEALALSVNPYQLYKAPPRRIWSASPASADVTVALTGQSATASQGSISPATSAGLSGQSVSLAQGLVTPAASTSISGQSVATSQGVVSTNAPLIVIDTHDGGHEPRKRRQAEWRKEREARDARKKQLSKLFGVSAEDDEPEVVERAEAVSLPPTAFAPKPTANDLRRIAKVLRREKIQQERAALPVSVQARAAPAAKEIVIAKDFEVANYFDEIEQDDEEILLLL